MKTGVELIAEERQEQIEKHGRTTELDIQTNKSRQLAYAAAVLATPLVGTPKRRSSLMPSDWDEVITLKMCTKPYKERLIIAGALIAAEIDRLNALD